MLLLLILHSFLFHTSPNFIYQINNSKMFCVNTHTQTDKALMYYYHLFLKTFERCVQVMHEFIAFPQTITINFNEEKCLPRKSPQKRPSFPSKLCWAVHEKSIKTIKRKIKKSNKKEGIFTSVELL